MKKADAEIAFTAALYGAMYPLVVDKGLEAGDDDSEIGNNLHQAMVVADRHAKVLASHYVRPIIKPFMAYREGKR